MKTFYGEFFGTGIAAEADVLLDRGDGVRRHFDPRPSLAVCNHSPTGFAWGYQGSGPAQLALGILLEITGDPELAEVLHQPFKSEVIARLDRDRGWVLTEAAVRDWMAATQRP